VIPDGVAYLPLDVRSDEQWATARQWVVAEWDGLDILVNNAGVATGGRIDLSTMDEWELATQVNLLGVARGCHAFAGLFKEQRSGYFVNVASIAGLVHPPAMAAYNAVKAGVVALSETLAHELAPYGVHSSVVCPSFFRTNIASAMRGRDADAATKMAKLVDDSPLSADDIAAAVLDGVEQQTFLILPDEVARASYDLKWTDRGAYDAQMQATATRAMEREQA
jgi:NAD(P)-dependent dehydrogenase (short-subunit alcohol dehydrogenase family)